MVGCACRGLIYLEHRARRARTVPGGQTRPKKSLYVTRAYAEGTPRIARCIPERTTSNEGSLPGRGVRGSLALLVTSAACSSENAVNRDDDDTSGGKGGGTYGLKIAVVTHGAAGDAFWSIVKNGVEKAGTDLGDTIQYSSDGDPQKQAQLIDAAVNQKVDGLVVSMANPDALKRRWRRRWRPASR